MAEGTYIPAQGSELAEDLKRRKQVVDIANRMAQQSALGVGQLQSAFGQQQAQMDQAALAGRRAIAQQAGQAVAAGATRGLRANVAGATDAAMQAAGARAGFESQMGQLRADQAVQQAQMMGQAQMEPLKQEMLAVEKAQELQATQAGADKRTTDALDALIASMPQSYFGLEFDENYAKRVVDQAVAKGIIPDNEDARLNAYSYVLRAAK